MTKKSLQEVRDIIESEGLGYAIQAYISGNSIEDAWLAKKWNQASELLYEIHEYICDSTEDE